MTSSRHRHRSTGSFAPEEVLAPESPLDDGDETRASVEIYLTPDGELSLPVRLDGDTVWATQAQIADLFGVDRDTVGAHLRNAFEEAELDRQTSTEDYSVVRREGSRRV
jgi:hypothetical protein